MRPEEAGGGHRRGSNIWQAAPAQAAPAQAAPAQAATAEAAAITATLNKRSKEKREGLS